MRWLVHQLVWIGKPAIRSRITTACENLERVYGPQLNPKERQAIATLSLESFLLAGLESIIEPVPESTIQVEGDGLLEMLRRQRDELPTIYACLHLGCWDICLRWISQRHQGLAVVYRPANNPFTDPLLHQTRRSNSDCLWIPKSDSLAMARHLRRGGGLVLMTDLPANPRTGLAVDFLGVETYLTPGPMHFSNRFDAPIFPIAHVREDDGTFRLVCGEPIQSDIPARQAAALSRWQERWIQQYADQYYWINRRWRGHDGRRLRQLPRPADRVLRRLPP